MERLVELQNNDETHSGNHKSVDEPAGLKDVVYIQFQIAGVQRNQTTHFHLIFPFDILRNVPQFAKFI